MSELPLHRLNEIKRVIALHLGQIADEIGATSDSKLTFVLTNRKLPDGYIIVSNGDLFDVAQTIDRALSRPENGVPIVTSEEIH